MKQQTLLTVATINFNNIAGIRRTLTSLSAPMLRSRALELQHLIVDGDSTDGSAEWARDNPAVPQTDVISEPDDGIYHAMNKALDLAHGKYILFINSGDEVASAQLLLDATNSLAGSSHRWLVGLCRIIDPATDQDFIKPYAWRRYSWMRETFLSYRICHPAVIAEVELLREHGGFDQDFAIAADYKLMTSVGRREKPLIYNGVLSNFYLGGVSDSDYTSSLHECHRARTQLISAVRLMAPFDLLMTQAQVRRARRSRKMPNQFKSC